MIIKVLLLLIIPTIVLAADYPHRYVTQQNDRYGYERALSKVDKAVGNVTTSLAFISYAGQENGIHQIIFNNSSTSLFRRLWTTDERISYAECSVPCKFATIKEFNGKIQLNVEQSNERTIRVDEKSLLGAMFQDAINGKLKRAVIRNLLDNKDYFIRFDRENYYGFMVPIEENASVAAGPLEDAIAAYNRKDYSTALRLFRPLADQGIASAQSYLGRMYNNGQGLPQDYVVAVTWYRKAAEQGDSSAQWSLGIMYYEGQGVPQDYTVAVEWFRKAAQRGDPHAQLALGVMYYEAKGVPQDYVQVHKWLNLAVARLPASDAETRANAIKARNRVASKMTPAQVAEAEKLTKEWKSK